MNTPQNSESYFYLRTNVLKISIPQLLSFLLFVFLVFFFSACSSDNNKQPSTEISEQIIKDPIINEKPKVVKVRISKNSIQNDSTFHYAVELVLFPQLPKIGDISMEISSKTTPDSIFFDKRPLFDLHHISTDHLDTVCGTIKLPALLKSGIPYYSITEGENIDNSHTLDFALIPIKDLNCYKQ